LELLKFIADGEIPDDSAKVIIQVGTSDPKIDSIIVTLTIEPSPLSVSINPPNISAGETAEIILTYKYSDGTTEVL